MTTFSLRTPIFLLDFVLKLRLPLRRFNALVKTVASKISDCIVAYEKKPFRLLQNLHSDSVWEFLNGCRNTVHEFGEEM